MPLEQAAEIFDCPHSTPTLTPDGPYVVRSQDIRSGVFLTDLAARVSEATYQDRIRRAEPRFGDLLFSREGTYFGIAAELPPDTRACLGQRMVLIRPAARLNPRFLRYWLNSPMLSEHAVGFYDGSVAQRLNVSTIRRLPVPVPSLADQLTIAGVLGVLDDKVALNRRTNRILESLVDELFQSWFVDLDPVFTTSSGRHTGGTGAAVTAMPTFVGADGGELPEGWSRVVLDELLTIVKEAVDPSATPNGEFDHYSIPAFDAAQLPAPELGSAIKSGKYRVPAGAILVSKLNPHTPRVWWPAPRVGSHSVCSTEFLPCIARAGVPYEFLYALLRSEEFTAKMSTLVTGTSNSHQRARPRDFIQMHVVKPTGPVMEAFASMVAPMLEKVRRNLLENKALAELRDALVPKLFSGAIGVREFERTATAVL